MVTRRKTLRQTKNTDWITTRTYYLFMLALTITMLALGFTFWNFMEQNPTGIIREGNACMVDRTVQEC